MLKAYQAGEFFVDPRCQTEVHLEITQFNPLKTDNVDNILDLLCYAPRVLEMYGELTLIHIWSALQPTSRLLGARQPTNGKPIDQISLEQCLCIWNGK